MADCLVSIFPLHPSHNDYDKKIRKMRDVIVGRNLFIFSSTCMEKNEWNETSRTESCSETVKESKFFLNNLYIVVRIELKPQISGDLRATYYLVTWCIAEVLTLNLLIEQK